MKHLKTHEAASLLGVSARAMESWRYNGIGPIFRKIGRRVFYEETDLLNWAVEQASEPATGNASQAVT